MRIFIILVSFFLYHNAVSQGANFDSLFYAGKAEFNKDFLDINYAQAAEKLEQAIALQPEHAEAHYYLGYAYSRMNSKDGSEMADMTLALTLKTSEQMERVNKLAPKYEGEIISLDPYSKLTAEWGSLAFSYWQREEADSALWAFQEGKKRGAFSEFFLTINRKILDLCAPNAILICSGDNHTIPLWYLQIVENYRPDVQLIDISLVNTIWYPKFLVKKNKLNFGFGPQDLDSVNYIPWSDSIVEIEILGAPPFTWLLQPSYYDAYLLRGERLLLALFQNNRFRREVYFTKGYQSDACLSLEDKFSSEILVDRIDYNAKGDMSFENYLATMPSIFTALKHYNGNSLLEESYLNNIRLGIFQRVYTLIQNEEFEKAKTLFALSEENLSTDDYPLNSSELTRFHHYLKENTK